MSIYCDQFRFQLTVKTSSLAQWLNLVTILADSELRKDGSRSIDAVSIGGISA